MKLIVACSVFVSVALGQLLLPGELMKKEDDLQCWYGDACQSYSKILINCDSVYSTASNYGLAYYSCLCDKDYASAVENCASCLCGASCTVDTLGYQSVCNDEYPALVSYLSSVEYSLTDSNLFGTASTGGAAVSLASATSTGVTKGSASPSPSITRSSTSSKSTVSESPKDTTSSGSSSKVAKKASSASDATFASSGSSFSSASAASAASTSTQTNGVSEPIAAGLMSFLSCLGLIVMV